MAQIIRAEIMDTLRALAEPLAKVAISYGPEITASDPSFGPEAIAEAIHVTAFSAAVAALLQSFPLTQRGVMVATATVAGVVLGQCDGDRQALYTIFKHQMAGTLAEMDAARMPTTGNA